MATLRKPVRGCGDCRIALEGGLSGRLGSDITTMLRVPLELRSREGAKTFSHIMKAISQLLHSPERSNRLWGRHLAAWGPAPVPRGHSGRPEVTERTQSPWVSRIQREYRR